MGNKQGRHITDKEKKAIVEAYQTEPTIKGVAVKLKHNRETVRRVLAENGVQVNSPEVIGNSILQKINKNPDMANANFDKLAAILGSNNVVGVMRHPERYKEAVVEQARTNLLIALHCLTIDNKLEQASPSAIAQVVPILAEIASGKYSLGGGVKQQVNAEEIMMSIKVAIKKVKSFNPVLAKETEEALAHIDAIDTTAFQIDKKK